MAKYTYANENVDPAALDIEVAAGTFTAKYDYMTTVEESPGGNRTVDVYTTFDLTGSEQTELDGIIAAHTP